MKESYDFSGWATRNDIECSDGRTIRKDAFKDNDGQKVPLVWNHNHDSIEEVLGHALLENREEGVYAYGKFNDTEAGQNAKKLVINGDIDKLSIYANRLKSQAKNVVHGCIREVSLVLAGANPGAYIDSVICHNDASGEDEEEGTIYTDATISIMEDHEEESGNASEEIEHADDQEKGEDDMNEEETIEDVFNTLSDKQKQAVYAIVGEALEHSDEDDEEESEKEESEKEEGEEESMKHNVFESDTKNTEQFLQHNDEVEIIKMAKDCGSLKKAMNAYINNNESLQHSFESIEELFPDYKLLNPGAPEKVDADYEWVRRVLDRAKKSPYSRVKSRFVNLKEADIRAMGYKKAEEKKLIGTWNLGGRSHDPQTVYVKDKLDRDDIIDITDFDVVVYQKGIMKDLLEREVARAALIGDGREDNDPDKIKAAHIQDIWHDDEFYTIHQNVDIAAARTELQGTDTDKHFGENYIYAEAIITAALYSREKYRGSGSLDFYCTPHLLNVMLLARDLNGRRIYDSKNDLAQALNVNNIYTIEQFENKKRSYEDATTHQTVTKKLLGIFVNMADYQFGSTKGGEITSFEDFDIDFNQYKYLMETRLSGALVHPFSAIALEEPDDNSDEISG